jgi:hypothetical protein
MNKQEVHALMRYCKTLDPRHVVGLSGSKEDVAIAVSAWFNELPVDLSPDAAKQIVHELAHLGKPLDAVNIGKRFDEQRTPKHQQSPTRQRRPGDPERVADVLAEIEPEPPLSGPETSALLDELGLRNGRKRRMLQVRCPHCGANKNEECTAGGKPLTKSPAHPSRIEAAGLEDSVEERQATVHMALQRAEAG